MDVILPEPVEFLCGGLHKHDGVYRSDVFVAECSLFPFPVFFPVSVILLRTVIFGEFLTDPLVLAQEQVRIIAGCPLPGEMYPIFWTSTFTMLPSDASTMMSMMTSV